MRTFAGGAFCSSNLVLIPLRWPFYALLSCSLLLLTGCFTQNEEVLTRSPDTWSSRDCLTVLESATRNNFKDDRSPNIKVCATMLAPSVIIAGHRRGVILSRQGTFHSLQATPPLERTENLADSDYVTSLDMLIQEEAGLYVDWQKGQYVDARGNYVKKYTQIDSLTFFVAIENKSWPCVPALMLPTVVPGVGVTPMRPLLGPGDLPCYVPDISNLEAEIYLLNDQNKFIRPITVWGKKEDLLMRPENLVIKFHIGKEDYHFLEQSDNIRLIITGFENRISLEYPVALLR